MSDFSQFVAHVFTISARHSLSKTLPVRSTCINWRGGVDRKIDRVVDVFDKPPSRLHVVFDIVRPIAEEDCTCGAF